LSGRDSCVEEIIDALSRDEDLILATLPLLLVEPEKKLLHALKESSSRLQRIKPRVYVIIDDTLEETVKCLKAFCSLEKAVDIVDLCRLVSLVDRINNLVSSMRVLRDAISKGADELRDKYIEHASQLDMLTAEVSEHWVKDPELVDAVIKILEEPAEWGASCLMKLASWIKGGFKPSSMEVEVVSVTWLLGSKWIPVEYELKVKSVIDELKRRFHKVMFVGDESKAIVVNRIVNKDEIILC
jgi:uncharacterized coiled-coil DUF342 family protein